jgi:hypothetical protein
MNAGWIFWHEPLGGTGRWPVVSGVAPETGARRELAWAWTQPQRCSRLAEIRRDAGFDGRDARATRTPCLAATCGIFILKD